MSIFWELWQQSRIREVEDSAAQAARASRNETRDAEQRLAERLDNIVLAQSAMWALVKDRFKLTDQDLMDAMERIDMADGVRDGKMGRVMQVCPVCKRRSAEHHNACMYCGAAFGPRSPFSG
ncbi:MAG: hypothetical protein U0637_08985 [Phycisphaerales bacterium]